ncbi:MAG: aromatic amino acid ammonia-lyase [Pirellulales bacterium]|nr:aromatic amino acid ammonia-lyase [Pirellulales bacterium]
MMETTPLVGYHATLDDVLAGFLDDVRRQDPLVLGRRALRLGEIYRAAHAGHAGALAPLPISIVEAGPLVDANRAAIARLQQWLDEKRVVYGVNTGFGGTGIFNKHLDQEGLRRQQEVLIDGLLVSGKQDALPPEVVRAAMLARVASNLVGVSGLRHDVMRLIVRLVHEDVVPIIPAKGSLTASGDLVPLAYLAATIQAQDDAQVEVWHRGQRTTARAALAALGLEPLRLEPKEGLALVNGTSMAAGAGSLAVVQAFNAYYLTIALTALANCVVRGTLQSYHPFVAEVKPHLGQIYSARLIFNLMHSTSDRLVPKGDVVGFAPAHEYRLWQLTYPFRCASQHLAPEYDVLMGAAHDLAIEVNGASDNPLILNDGTRQFAVSGGNFLGSTVARDMDKLKLSFHSLARLVHAQFKFLIRGVDHIVSATESQTVRERFIATHVIPLSSHPADNMGFQGVEIYMDALLSEMNQRVGPHSTTYLSAEKENQAIVSMGLAAARTALDLAADTDYCLAAHLLACCQAFDLATLPPELIRAHEGRRENLVCENPRAEELGHLRPLYDFLRRDLGVPTLCTSTRMHGYLTELVRRVSKLELLQVFHTSCLQPALADDAYARHCRGGSREGVAGE